MGFGYAQEFLDQVGESVRILKPCAVQDSSVLTQNEWVFLLKFPQWLAIAECLTKCLRLLQSKTSGNSCCVSFSRSQLDSESERFRRHWAQNKVHQ